MAGISQNVVDQINAILNGGGTATATSSTSVVQNPYNTGGTYGGSGVSPMTPFNPYDQANAQAQMGAINAAGPDTFDKVIGNVRDTRRQLLESIAGAGSEGRAEFQRQSAQAAAGQQARVAAAVAAAQRRNADPTTIAALQGTINQPYEQGQSDREANQGRWDNLFRALGAANEGFFAKYEQSLPLIQQQFKNDLASNFALARAGGMAEIEKGRQSTSLSLAELQLQEALRNAEFREGEADDLAAQQRWQSEFDFQKEQARLEAERDQRDFDEDVRRFGLQYALDQAKLKASMASSGGGSGRGGSGGGGYAGTGISKTDLTAMMPGLAAQRASTYKGPFGAGMVGGLTMGAGISPQQYAAQLMEREDQQVPGVYSSLLPKSTYKPQSANAAERDAYETKIYDWASDGLRQGLTAAQVTQRMLADPQFGNNETTKRIIAEAVADAQANMGWAGRLGSGIRSGIGRVGSF